MEADVDAEGDETNDVEVYEHEARHVISETMSTLLMEHAPTKRKVDPMIFYEDHQMYKASLVSLLVGNQTLSKDRLTHIKQSVYFNGMKPKPRVNGVPVCIMDFGSDWCCCLIILIISSASVLEDFELGRRGEGMDKRIKSGLEEFRK
ncbi:hypothetical protein R1flu_017498 [Riccia fluitans]|uniref:Uncharacterized protein n=1 Tax=Riccia fluitans TaxID=41844 RepID=A0ABD1ZEF1_9MARC